MALTSRQFASEDDYARMRRLRTLGATVAFVNSLLGAEAPSALYESVGMPVLDINYPWVKTL